ncbi:uncharacterized protein BO80DRAFT_422444 [Aspergillus ibericus CBS 121593]|uniref:Extracellular membrane protein CFEM domain-containing protein n=1 Tax=Aspergillus ibericus CBS 121593 TaxID=1448316 RepID=A0A395H913_9EURO|nr:hypothetical protein BO80DRAFT_422444 [Aspergillus ibericus CBS 121593]RAL04059.1 hypothetical protein BO80DRAFT_422444 [Aspergillus ibericus CBS 121593]
MKVTVFTISILSLASFTSAAVLGFPSTRYAQNCGYLAVRCANHENYDKFHQCIQNAMQGEGCGYSG